MAVFRKLDLICTNVKRKEQCKKGVEEADKRIVGRITSLSGQG